MIYLKDILLTCAALFLLNAALSAKSRITQASAQLEADFSGEPRKFEADLQIGSLMSKVRHLQQDKRENAIRKSLARPTVVAAADEEGEHRENNSYRYYANKTSHLEQHQQHPLRQPGASKPVEVGFLRSSLAAGNEPAGDRNNNATLVYMLSNATPSDSAQVNEIDTGEQQQQPPFTMMPPFNQQQQQQQQQLLLQQQLNGPQNNIRQILSNYQRLAAAQVPQAGQQLAPGPNQGNNNINGEQPLLRPPANPYQAHNAPGQPQQPFSPLQLITGPLQAFQNALNPQNNNNNQPHNVPPAGIPAPALAPAAGQPQTKPAQQQPQPPGFLQQLNPFGPQLNPQQQQQQLPNLQALYQQLPLYQALLAARQRQEALQAAHKARQQQQQPLSGGLINAGQPATPQAPALQPNYPQQVNQPVNQVNFPQNQPEQQQQQPPPAPVQFDDDNNVNTNNDNTSNNNNSNDNSGQQEQANQNEQPEGNNNNGPGEQADQNNNNNHEQGGGGGGGEAPQEEDPDLKQFQNLANGGDSFTDLFPPGILSNNDITDIKTQQAEQAKKQEEEERQRQLRNQQAQTQSQQPQQHFHQQQNQQQQPAQLQPINQFANNQQQQQQQQQPGNNQVGQEDTANDNSNNDDEPQNEGGQNEEEGGENEGNNETEPADGNGQEEQEGGEPEAAALTAKSLGASDDGNTTAAAKLKLTSSPGVVYSREAKA